MCPLWSPIPSHQRFEQSYPSIAIVPPSSEISNPVQCRFAHARLQWPIFSKLLDAISQCVHIANGNNKPLNTVREEILGSGVGAGDNRASARHRLALNKRQPFFNAGKHHHMARTHVAGNLRLWL